MVKASLVYIVSSRPVCAAQDVSKNNDKKQRSGLGNQAYWHTSLIPALRRQRQADLCKSEANVVYIVSSRLVRAT